MGSPMGLQAAHQAIPHAMDVSKPVKAALLLLLDCPSPVYHEINAWDLQMPVTRVDGLVLSLCGRHLLAICGDKAIREFSIAERLATAHAPAHQPASADAEVRAAKTQSDDCMAYQTRQ